MPSRPVLSFFLLFCSVIAATPSYAAMDPRFELDLTTLQPPGTSAQPSAARPSPRKPVRTPRDGGTPQRQGGTTYTVRPGDHLFKILMRDYGLTNDEAESFIEEIRQENNIYDIRRLRVGQKIVIPPVRRRADGSLKVTAQRPLARAASGEAKQTLTLEAPQVRMDEQEAVNRFKNAWTHIVPGGAEPQKPLSISSPYFSLTLDPQRYPIYPAQDGGRILVDRAGAIPPLVRSLIVEKDPTIRIVAESPADSRRFLASVLSNAGFYSVEEDFSMEFGIDPKLTVHADFKVEKSADSLIRQELLLVNAGQSALPPVLGEFLKKEGVSVVEPFASQTHLFSITPRTIHQIGAPRQADQVDALLAALDISADHDRRIDVFAADNNGISLSVKADRSFARNGQRYAVTRFDGDPVTYTLFRILETKGYRVVILEKQDDFRKVTEKLLDRLKLPGTFNRHTLISGDGSRYSLQMSGFRLDDPSLPGGGTFITNLEMDKIVRALLTENGYTFKTK